MVIKHLVWASHGTKMLKVSSQRQMVVALCCGIMALTSCEHEIDFDFPTAEAQVVFEGEVSNERTFVRISHTRAMTDSTKNHFIGDAKVWISVDGGAEEQLYYDASKKSYLSAMGLTAQPGHTYHMRAIVDGNQYEATSTMQPTIEVDSVAFRWVDVLKERIFFYYIKGKDPIADARSYTLCRLYRGNELFRWNARSGRSSIDGIFEYDIICSSNKEIDDGKSESGQLPLADGDTIRAEILNIDRHTWEFFHSLMYGESTASNAISNIGGGARGVFMAAYITRPDTLVFDREKLAEKKE